MLGFRLSLHRPTGELCSIFDEAAYRLRRDKVATWGNLRDEVGSGGGADGGIVAAYIVTATSRPINKSEGDEWWSKLVREPPSHPSAKDVSEKAKLFNGTGAKFNIPSLPSVAV